MTQRKIKTLIKSEIYKVYCHYKGQSTIPCIPCIFDFKELVSIPENSICFFLGEQEPVSETVFYKCLVIGKIVWIDQGWFMENL